MTMLAWPRGVPLKSSAVVCILLCLFCATAVKRCVALARIVRVWNGGRSAATMGRLVQISRRKLVDALAERALLSRTWFGRCIVPLTASTRHPPQTNSCEPLANDFPPQTTSERLRHLLENNALSKKPSTFTRERNGGVEALTILAPRVDHWNEFPVRIDFYREDGCTEVRPSRIYIMSDVRIAEFRGLDAFACGHL